MQRGRVHYYFILLCIVITISMLLIESGCRYTDNLSYRSTETYRTLLKSMGTKPQNVTETILENTRTKIKLDLLNYNFTYSNVHKLEDLVMESGGKPIRNIIVSTWRSGSSFFGDFLNAMPSNFYNYEPLMIFKIRQIRGPPRSDNATNILKKMLRCDYGGLESYFKYAKQISEVVNQIKLNERIWQQCKYNIDLCYDANFMTAICKLYPFQSVKLVRLRLGLVESILEDDDINAKVVLLVRDPRGVMNSRRSIKNFCSKNKVPDCAKPEYLCYDMASDYIAAKRILQKFPNRLMVLRFEDLILNLTNIKLELLNFLQFGYTESIDEFLQTHTNISNFNTFSTIRISREVPFKWARAMDFAHVKEIQDKCREAMEMWGYQLAQNASHMASNDFNPLLPYYLT